MTAEVDRPNRDERIDPLATSYMLAFMASLNAVENFRRGNYAKALMSASFSLAVAESAIRYRYGGEYSELREVAFRVATSTLERGLSRALSCLGRQITNRRLGL